MKYDKYGLVESLINTGAIMISGEEENLKEAGFNSVKSLEDYFSRLGLLTEYIENYSKISNTTMRYIRLIK